MLGGGYVLGVQNRVFAAMTGDNLFTFGYIHIHTYV